MLYSIYAESTPNPEVMKFVANRPLTANSIEVTSEDEVKDHLIIIELFKFTYIKKIYINNNFISITKNSEEKWENIVMHIRNYITDILNNNKNFISKNNDTVQHKNLKNNNSFSNSEKEIEKILNDYIRPAVEGDGGEIALKSVEGNIVTVIMKGACSGCPSASITLKNGVEHLLQTKINKDIKVVAEEI